MSADGKMAFDVWVCPECLEQLGPEGDEYAIECYDHGYLVAGVMVKVAADRDDVRRQAEQGRA